ncbi:MAG: ABC transporter ATP-binding protein [Acidobacteriota bacterium]
MHTDLLSEKIGNLFRRKTRSNQAAKTDLWALKDVTFQVGEGEVVGIIGRNGAGKSTLLKILSRITAPTSGRAVVRGRLAGLLEVGTGFHPELTGRENIYLNGTILGMRRREIDQKLDEIIAFSEVERFLDTPVKRYSSGMYVRLAFAVAAHLDPEVLVVDEVLAVGDRQFQEKCISRLESMSRDSGRTVLLVTHNLDTVQRLCTRGILLKQGGLDFDGPVSQAIERYIKDSRSGDRGDDLATRLDRWGSGALIAARFDVTDEDGTAAATLKSGGNYYFRVELRHRDPEFRSEHIDLAIEIRDSRDITVWLVYSAFSGEALRVDESHSTVECHVTDLNLAPGEYSVTLFISRGGKDVLDCIHAAAILTVAGGDFFGTGSIGIPEQCRTLTRAQWRVLRAEPEPARTTTADPCGEAILLDRPTGTRK